MASKLILTRCKMTTRFDETFNIQRYATSSLQSFVFNSNKISIFTAGFFQNVFFFANERIN